MSEEKTDWRKCAFHYDNEIVTKLIVSMLVFAVSEWNRTKNIKMEDDGQKYHMREKAREFFNSSFFGDILAVLAPEVDQQTACDIINSNTRRFNIGGWEINNKKRHCDRHSDV